MSLATLLDQPLAIHGGPKAVPAPEADLFSWPPVTQEDEKAILDVVRAGAMSGIEITRQFEKEWSEYLGLRYSLAHSSGTASLLGCMFGCGVGRGDEIISPSLTYWASALQCLTLGATPVFADIDPISLTIDPKDIEHRITPRTRALVVVHYCGHPADMDPIMAIARKHNLKVIEDVSHAHGGRYKGRILGTIGDCAGFSMMAGKSFAIGEAGMLSTNDRSIYERAVALGHYERCRNELTDPTLKAWAGPADFPTGLPLGGYKFRMNQTCSAMGRVQLKYYESRMKFIQDGMNRFWDLLEGCPGLRAHRPNAQELVQGTTMGGWYNPLGHYVPEELGGLPVTRFIEAVNAEGGSSGRGCNFPLHLHPVLNEADVYRDGRPTRIAFSDRDVRQKSGSLPVTERLGSRCLGVPWFKHDRPESIKHYAAAFRKVAMQASTIR